MKALHDEVAYPIVASIVDTAEERLVAKGICSREDAARYLALDYIATCSSTVRHSVQYFESDERTGAGMFLAKLPMGKLKTQYRRIEQRCAAHLASRPALHFPDYEPLLRVALLQVLRSIEDVRTLRSHGVVLLACGALAEVRTDIRRELRRRGLPYDPTLVDDVTIARRVDDLRWHVQRVQIGS